MICPKCHTEVEKGFLYCPKCLTEIPWVREFDSVETLMEKKKREEPPAPPVRETNPVKKRWPYSKRKALVLCVLILSVMGGFCHHQLHTFSAVYMRADKAFNSGDYESALKYTQEALEKKPKSLSANMLLAQTLEEQGDLESAVMVMTPLLKLYPEEISVYQRMLGFLSEEGRTAEIEKILENCESQKVLDACSEYICAAPVSSPAPGTYTSTQVVKLTADYSEIYYTTDGTTPTRESTLYTEPIFLPEGVTQLNAFGVNGKNIPSDVISRKYVIVLRIPKSPHVFPENGTFTRDTKIEVTVPEGCRAYYAFDEQPTASSTEYKCPISMPQGAHTFHVFLVAANGKTSEVTSKEYYLEY